MVIRENLPQCFDPTSQSVAYWVDVCQYAYALLDMLLKLLDLLSIGRAQGASLSARVL